MKKKKVPIDFKDDFLQCTPPRRLKNASNKMLLYLFDLGDFNEVAKKIEKCRFIFIFFNSFFFFNFFLLKQPYFGISEIFLDSL